MCYPSLGSQLPTLAGRKKRAKQMTLRNSHPLNSSSYKAGQCGKDTFTKQSELHFKLALHSLEEKKTKEKQNPKEK